MASRIICVMCSLVALCIVIAAQTEPTLVTVNLPTYPPLARQARLEGAVKLSFTLSANAGEPTNVEVVSGHPMFKEAALKNVKTWRFENHYAVERRYETTLTFRLSGVEVSAPSTTRVTFDSFHHVDLVADVVETTVNY